MFSHIKRYNYSKIADLLDRLELDQQKFVAIFFQYKKCSVQYVMQ